MLSVESPSFWHIVAQVNLPPTHLNAGRHHRHVGIRQDVLVESIAWGPLVGKTLGLNVAGVDLLRSNHGPVVMEVNSSPGLEGIEKATGKDIAGQIIEFLETHAKPGKTKTRGRG